MSLEASKNQHLSIALSDLFLICKKRRFFLLLFVVTFGLLAFFYSLTTVPEYMSQATFREKGKSQAGVNYGSFTSMILSGVTPPGNQEAISTLKSRTLVEDLIRRLGLQASINKKGSQSSILTTMKNNLLVEIALWRRKPGLVLPDISQGVEMINVKYDHVFPAGLQLKFLDDKEFEVTWSKEKIKGRIGDQVKLDGLQFTLVGMQPQPMQEYQINLQPMYLTLKTVTSKLFIESDREDKTLLYLRYNHENRFKSAEVLNCLMEIYQDYLKIEQKRVLNEQLAYLQSRHDSMSKQLNQMMEEQASALSSEVISSGFPSANDALEFWAGTQREYAKSLLAIELELRRLNQAKQEGSTFYERYSSEGNGAPVINTIVSQIRQLKQQSDSLELAVREEASKDESKMAKGQEEISYQFTQLEEVQHYLEEANQMIALLSQEKLPGSEFRLYSDSRFMIKTWCEKLIQSKEKAAEYESCKANFHNYLENLIHLMKVQENAITERLTHQQNIHHEFQGIDLETARELYINYNRDLNAVEAEIKQKQFIAEQMKDPAFEISSLSTVLRDNVSQNMISQASDLLLNLKDQKNRSLKEQERLREELEIQKKFLGIHLDQTIQLLSLHEKLLKEKILALQNTRLVLVQEEISVLEKHLHDHISTRITNLLQERDVLERHQRELQREMAKLPAKWASEKLFDQQMKLSGHMVEEVTHLVETKNTTSNLELIQSAPLDNAISPVQPKSPKLILLTLVGSLFGAFFAISIIFVQSITKGLLVTFENLRFSGQHVSGVLSNQYQSRSKHLSDHDLNCLRKLSTFLQTEAVAKSLKKRVLLVIGRGQDYSQDLAELFVKKGTRVLLMPLIFDGSEGSNEGLLQYLEGQVNEPLITEKDGYHVLCPGGISRFSNELLGSHAFSQLMEKLDKQYDWILAITKKSTKDSETEQLANVFDEIVISITEQNWNEISHLVALSKDKALSFLLSDQQHTNLGNNLECGNLSQISIARLVSRNTVS